MGSFIEKIFEYSISIAILVVIVFYFIKKNDKKDEKIDEMHKEFVQLIKENNEMMEKSCKEMIKKLEDFSKK